MTVKMFNEGQLWHNLPKIDIQNIEKEEFNKTASF
jgi:hypothetical protein